jgi:hypothetical protein
MAHTHPHGQREGDDWEQARIGRQYDTEKGDLMATQAANADWLALTVEEPLEPELPICDPHHHLWDLRPGRVAPRYLLDEILADVRGP